MAKILIVDDEPMINDMIRHDLIMVGFACDQAYDGKQALEKVEKIHMILSYLILCCHIYQDLN